MVPGPGAPPVPWPRSLAGGDRLLTWVDSDVRIGEPEAGGRPVPDAPVGAVVARFDSGGPFAWPDEPTVWSAPSSGSLAFGINARAAHRPRGAARVVLVPLTDRVRRAYPPPAIGVRRAEGGLEVRFRDRAGFGLDRRSLAFHLTTSRGTRYRLAAWAPVGRGRVVLPLPPPISLSPGVHEMRAEIHDLLGNVGRSGVVRFDTP